MELTKRDFGVVFAGEELEQNFPVRNIGSKPLELTEKSTLGIYSTPSDRPVATALVHPPGQFTTRLASATPAAPS
ncbi:MAG: hypothetical protein WAV20_13380 [Blastocatellia bacterium]